MKKNNYSVYKYTNKTNGKVYIGITTRSMEKRHKEHLKTINDGLYFHNALKKYGVDNFKLSQIDSANNKKELADKEKHYIELFESYAYQGNSKGYNCTFGGDGVTGMIGELNPQYGISPKDRMNKEKYEMWLETVKNPNEETRKKMREVFKNNNFFLGRTHTEETKKHFSEIRKGKPALNKVKINQYDLGGSLVATYNSISEAIKSMGKSSLAGISMCCNGKRKTAYGYVWECA